MLAQPGLEHKAQHFGVWAPLPNQEDGELKEVAFCLIWPHPAKTNNHPDFKHPLSYIYFLNDNKSFFKSETWKERVVSENQTPKSVGKELEAHDVYFQIFSDNTLCDLGNLFPVLRLSVFIHSNGMVPQTLLSAYLEICRWKAICR